MRMVQQSLSQRKKSLRNGGTAIGLSAVVFFMVGLALGAGVMGLYMIVCGFFLLPSHIPDGWYWVHRYVSFHTYSFTIFMKNEFEDFKQGSIDGNAVLEFYEMDEIEISECFVYLVIMMVVYRIIFYCLLRFLNRRQK